MRSKRGYLSVSLVSRDGSSRGVFVHALVAAAFLGPRPVGLEVDHIDGDKGNNSVANLEYVTHAENIRRKVEAGRPYKCSACGGAGHNKATCRGVPHFRGHVQGEESASGFFPIYRPRPSHEIALAVLAAAGAR